MASRVIVSLAVESETLASAEQSEGEVWDKNPPGNGHHLSGLHSHLSEAILSLYQYQAVFNRKGWGRQISLGNVGC